MKKDSLKSESKTKHIDISSNVHARVLAVKPKKFKNGPFFEDILMWGLEAYQKHTSENNVSL